MLAPNRDHPMIGPKPAEDSFPTQDRSPHPPTAAATITLDAAA
jgi:hypothetical protein